jgi:hypothetical protein
MKSSDDYGDRILRIREIRYALIDQPAMQFDSKTLFETHSMITGWRALEHLLS